MFIYRWLWLISEKCDTRFWEGGWMGADLTYLTSVDATRRRIVGVSGAYAWSIELDVFAPITSLSLSLIISLYFIIAYTLCVIK